MSLLLQSDVNMTAPDPNTPVITNLDANVLVRLKPSDFQSIGNGTRATNIVCAEGTGDTAWRTFKVDTGNGTGWAGPIVLQTGGANGGPTLSFDKTAKLDNFVGTAGTAINLATRPLTFCFVTKIRTFPGSGTWAMLESNHTTVGTPSYVYPILKSSQNCMEFTQASGNIDPPLPAPLNASGYGVVIWTDNGASSVYKLGANVVTAMSRSTTNPINGITVGGYSSAIGSNTGFDGQVDDLTIFDYAMNAQQIADLYAARCETYGIAP